MDKYISNGMTGVSGPVLAEMLKPLEPADFFARYWDCTPFYMSGEAGRFNKVMTNQKFCEALFKAKLGDRKLKYLQKSLGDRESSLDFFLRKKATWKEALSIEQLARELHKGTLVYDSIQKAVPSAQSFCRAIFPDFGCLTTINAYFSAGPDASAFDAHFDPQDVFILQIEGEKEWRLWERDRVTNPIAGFPELKSVASPELPADETVLMTAGDVLYVPRGTWHWPRSLDDEPSLHLTLTLVMPKPTDISHWLVQMLSAQSELRSVLPFSKHQPDMPVDSKLLDKAIAFLLQKLAASDAKALAAAYMSFEAMKSVMQAADSSDESTET